MEAMRHFTPEVACAYVRAIKWPEGPCCPKCGSVNVGTIKSRNKCQCREKGCRAQFSLTTDTIFEGTHLRLDQWLVGVWMIVNCRNGVSSCEIARTLGCKQQSAWHLLHRVRHILQQSNQDLLWGAVESDTTMVGGEYRNMTAERRERMRKHERPMGKAIVHAFRGRGRGVVRASVMDNASKDNILKALVENVRPGSLLYTDAAPVYKAFSAWRHHSVNHSAGEYVRGPVHTNGCENFFNCLRRALKGTYIRATPEHLGAYVDEAVFRFNVRKMDEWERFEKAMRLILGKRLTYSDLTGGAVR